jgi:putative pantetheine hydrolase
MVLMEAGADCVARAIVHALLAATSVDRSADGGLAIRSWSEAFPSALA